MSTYFETATDRELEELEAIQPQVIVELERLHNVNACLLAALKALVATVRTFRNVPKKEQEWTSLDEAALTEAFAAIEEAEQL